jgi:hypothetical protein
MRIPKRAPTGRLALLILLDRFRVGQAFVLATRGGDPAAVKAFVGTTARRSSLPSSRNDDDKGGGGGWYDDYEDFVSGLNFEGGGWDNDGADAPSTGGVDRGDRGGGRGRGRGGGRSAGEGARRQERTRHIFLAATSF